ncbi:group II intron maturase-specific domain-containing protein [Chungangia koreensis]|uniref:Group II intron maturase-specific domain-containing protein n=1 Tax=Chungangia koreensis TaxID=752657 RepID=A0ABV8X2D7_9LACT
MVNQLQLENQYGVSNPQTEPIGSGDGFNYFKIGNIKKYALKIDSHVRRRSRACKWKEWKKPSTKYRELKKCGIKPVDAWRCAKPRKGYWRLS